MNLGSHCDNPSESPQLSISSQKFGLAEQIHGFRGIHFQAIVGLGYPSLAQAGALPMFDNLMAQHSLTDNLFAFYMVSSFEEHFGLKSEMTLGYMDLQKFTGELKWHPVRYQYMYGMKLDDVKVNGKSLELGCQEKECLVTIDSGTSHLAMPTWAYEMVKGKVPLRDTGVPCDSTEEFGELVYVIDGVEYAIPNNEWTFEPESDKKPYVEKNRHAINLQLSDETEKKRCRGAIRQRDLRKEMFVVGNIFMTNFYSVFDRDNDRVGLAKKVTVQPPKDH